MLTGDCRCGNETHSVHTASTFAAITTTTIINQFFYDCYCFQLNLFDCPSFFFLIHTDVGVIPKNEVGDNCSRDFVFDRHDAPLAEPTASSFAELKELEI